MSKITMTSLLAVMLLTGCANQEGGFTKQQAGTVLGGATGALVGSQFGKGSSRIVGAGVGGVIGALAGSAIGKSMDHQEYKEPTYRDRDQRYSDRDPDRYYRRRDSDRYYEGRRDSRHYYYYED